MKTEGRHTVTILHVEKHFWCAVNDSDLANNCKLTEQYPTLYFPSNAHNIKKLRVIKTF